MACPTQSRAPGTLEQFAKPVPGSLASILRQYKSSVTRLIAAQFGAVAGIWQRNYYEHVVRDEDDLQRITAYIQCNVARWMDDDDNPERPA